MQGELHDLVDAKVGQKVRERRAMLGLSQRDLAQSLGISPQQMAKYERGTSSLSAGRLYQVAERLNVPIALLFADVHEPAETPATDGGSVADGEVSRELFDIVRTYASLSDGGVQTAVRHLLRAVASEDRAHRLRRAQEG
ncbi:Transcriptional regulator, contains XRE-family HTH domain [Limimonas halophila]|uniref:Transcriptional regulator, contains XRE-family HTH domain n=1 Tax=Limimonas halophila TaxID=1082479 RepID=A0A1G7LWU3_9PROT|nr:helix-turn-helix transcriptional regulator [Limimonas halophila]SDF53439.1 Transcriptional regulator, contains XRE-family HTH domain [Limimonas halophila]